MDIAVVGAGVAGLLPAYYLAKRGHRVTVYDEGPYPATRCSHANGGQVGVSNSAVWTTWNNLKKAAGWVFKADAPLLVRPSLDPERALWLGKFLWHTAKGDADKRTARTIQLGMESRLHYDELFAAEGMAFRPNRCGILHIYRTRAAHLAAMKDADMYTSAGCEWTDVSDRIGEVEPTLEGRHDITGGIWTPSDWVGDIHEFCNELAGILASRYGVSFIYNYKVSSLDELLGHSAVVVANGVGARALAATAGDNLPVHPVKGYSITITPEHTKGRGVLPHTSILDDSAKVVSSTFGGRLRVAGTAEFAGYNYDIRRARIEPLLNWVRDLLPAVDRRVYSQWACLRPMTPDNMPIVGRSRKPRVYYHTGHGHLGWTVAPATAVALVKLMEELE